MPNALRMKQMKSIFFCLGTPEMQNISIVIGKRNGKGLKMEKQLMEGRED